MAFDSKQMASKFLDGDLNSKQEIDQLISESEAKNAYSRYQLIGNIMRQEAVSPDVSIADSVMASLEREATILAPQVDKASNLDASHSNVISLPNRFGKQVGGFAIAASVALVALFSSDIVTQNNAYQNGLTQGLVANIDSNHQKSNTVNRADLQKAHQLFTNVSQLQNAGLPVIQTVSNQKAVAITIPLASSSVESELEVNELQILEQSKQNNQNENKLDDKK